MDIIIYGIGINCEKVIKKIEEFDDIHLLGLADSYKKENQWHLPMINIEDDATQYRKVPIVISIGNQEEVLNVYHKLRLLGYTNIYRFLNKTYCWKRDFLYGECVKIEKVDVNWMPLLVMHVADHCNLNCKCCTNFAPLFENSFPDYEQNMADIKKMQELIGGVLEFNIIGGEPFLNSQIEDYVIGIKERMPTISIRILTNGLLIPKIDEKILMSLHNNDVTILISEYEPTHRIIDKIKKRLESYQVDYCLIGYDVKDKFYKILSLSENSIYPQECISQLCVTIGNGKIARCPTLFYIDKLNSKFGVNFPEEGSFHLTDFIDGNDLKIQMTRQFPLCKYCIKKEVLWSQCEREVKLEDFVENE